jgi:hypothetical protein
MHTCVSLSPPFLSFRICKVACPGGSAVPKAKPFFWLLSHKKMSEGVGGLMRWEPVMIRCEPNIACRFGNTCSLQYEGTGCAKCKFGYWSHPKTRICTPCGFEQKMAMVIVSGLGVCASFGVLVGVSSFMRFKSDLQFRHKLFEALKQNIVKPLKKSKALFKFANAGSKGAMKSCTIEVYPEDVGMSLPYMMKKDLGVGLRVDSEGLIHVTGIKRDSPLRGKISPDWQLTTLNTRRIKAVNDADVSAQISRARLPMRMTFAFKRADIPDESGSDDELNFDDDRKAVVVLISIMNSFSALSSFDFEWPDLFSQLAALAAQFAFDLNFFKPECSVKAKFSVRWMGFLMVPYGMVGPLVTSFFISRFFTLRGQGPDARYVKNWNLQGAVAKVMCVLAIVLMPFHISQIIIPFCCIDQGGGIRKVAAAPDIRCDLEGDAEYKVLFRVGCVALFNVVCFYSFLMTCIIKCFWWQYTNVSRQTIPFYCAIVETSVQAQRGYQKNVRKRVNENVASVMAWMVPPESMELREKICSAIEHLAWRGRHIQQTVNSRRQQGTHAENRYLGLSELMNYGSFFEPDPLVEEAKSKATIAAESVRVMRAKQKFKFKRHSPLSVHGNFVTYGWIFIVNQFMRSMITNLVLNITKATLTVVGACFQMVVFAFNVLLLLHFKPYLAKRIVYSEIILLVALFMVLWAAVIKDLLSNHEQASELTHYIGYMSMMINTMAITIMILALILPFWNASFTVIKIARAIKGEESLLNMIHWNQYKKQELETQIERAIMEKDGILWSTPELMKEEGHDGFSSAELLKIAMNEFYPTVGKVLNELRAGELSKQSPEERAKLIKFVELVRANAKTVSAGVDLHDKMTIAQMIEETTKGQNAQQDEGADESKSRKSDRKSARVSDTVAGGQGGKTGRGSIAG